MWFCLIWEFGDWHNRCIVGVSCDGVTLSLLDCLELPAIADLMNREMND